MTTMRFVKPIFNLITLGLGFLSLDCSGSRNEGNGIGEPPLPIFLIMSSNPILNIDNSDPTHPNLWVTTVNQMVQFHATHPTTGNLVDNQVTWSIGPSKSTLDPIGTISQTGEYTAPSSPSWVGVGANNESISPPLRGQAGIEIVAAPVITSFTASATTISISQSVFLTPVFAEGKGQLMVGTQVLQTGLTSGTPVSVTPSATTTYTLVVTNLAGAAVRRDLTIAVQ